MEEAAWMDREVGGEFVMTQRQRDEMKRGCTKLVCLKEGRGNGRSKKVEERG